MVSCCSNAGIHADAAIQRSECYVLNMIYQPFIMAVI